MDRMEQKILERIDQNREKIIAFARDIYDHAELGYKEYRTAGKFVEALRDTGITEIQEKLAVTGVKGYLSGGQEGPTVALIGELDALAFPTMPMPGPRPAPPTAVATMPRWQALWARRSP